MKWIKLDDMRPPVGMYVIVIYGSSMAIIEWKQQYNEDEGEYISFDSNYGGRCKPIYQIDGWAPISFFDKYMDDKYVESEENDWYAQHKDNPLVNIIKEMSGEECSFLSKCKIDTLFYLISNGETEYIAPDYEPVSMTFDANLLSTPTPNLLEKLEDATKPSLSKRTSKTLSFRSYPAREYTINYRNSITGKVIDKDATIPVSEASQWNEFYIYKEC